MTKKDAKIKALRIATALIYASENSHGYFDGSCSEAETNAITKELSVIGKSLYTRASKLGGVFNPHTGELYPSFNFKQKNKKNG